MVRASFAKDLEEVAGEEPIDAIVIGAFGGSDYVEKLAHNEPEPILPLDQRGKLLLWHEARPFLDYQFNDGYGGAECHSVYAWTPTRVLFVSTYDGSTQVEAIPRNPGNHLPRMPGGG